MRKLTSFGVVLVAVLMTSSAYGAPGDEWDLQADFATFASGNPRSITRLPSADTGIWRHTHEGATLTGPITNNFQTAYPANVGWHRAADPSQCMCLFSADSTHTTNFLTGEVGGHSSTGLGVGTTWTSVDGGQFQVDFSGFLSRLVPNQSQALLLTSPGGVESFPIDQTGNVSSANAFSDTRTFTLNPNESISLTMKGSDFFGMTMHIEQVPEPSSLLLLGLAALGMCGRQFRRG
jgi:hypothetical protein